MSRKSGKHHADKREGGKFLALPHMVLGSAQFGELSARATKLLLDLLSSYRGTNNGDLCAAMTLMTKRGWRSKSQLQHAAAELERAGFIVVTRQGGRNKAKLFGVTFYEIDWCAGKLDIAAPNRTFMGLWTKVLPQADPRSRQPKGPRSLPAPSTGQYFGHYPTGGAIRLLHQANCPSGRPSQPLFDTPIAPPAGTFLDSPSRERLAA